MEVNTVTNFESLNETLQMDIMPAISQLLFEFI